MAGTEKRRSTEQRNTVTIRVAATQDSIFDWREQGAHVTPHRQQQDDGARDDNDRQPGAPMNLAARMMG
jgi:hypothetical protein